jgi:hypothetical protein
MNKYDSSNNSTSVIMDLEKLQQKYSNLLIKYKQSVTDYINYLNTENVNKTSQFISIQGTAYTGTGSAGQSTAKTLQECQAACSAKSTCTGATFVSGKCNIRIGDSPIIPSSKNSYAIIPKSKQLLMNMNNLNSQLLKINKQITNKIKIGQPIYNEIESKNNKISQELIKNYIELERERENILKLLEDYETLDTTENENQIKIKQNYYTYILLFILAIAVIFLLIKISYLGSSTSASVIQYGGKLNKTAYYVIFVILVLVIGINISIKKSLFNN